MNRTCTSSIIDDPKRRRHRTSARHRAPRVPGARPPSCPFGRHGELDGDHTCVLTPERALLHRSPVIGSPASSPWCPSSRGLTSPFFDRGCEHDFQRAFGFRPAVATEETGLVPRELIEDLFVSHFSVSRTGGSQNDSGTRVRAAAEPSWTASSTPRRGRQFSVRRTEVVGHLLLGVEVFIGCLLVGAVVDYGVERRSEKVQRVDILEPDRNRRFEAGVPRSRTRAVGTLGTVTAAISFSLRSSSKVPTSMWGTLALCFRAEGVIEQLRLDDV
jgi:hypothetical protein